MKHSESSKNVRATVSVVLAVLIACWTLLLFMLPTHETWGGLSDTLDVQIVLSAATFLVTLALLLVLRPARRMVYVYVALMVAIGLRLAQLCVALHGGPTL